MTVAELIARLQTKDQSDEVEFIVVKLTGEIVTMLAMSQAKPMIKVLKLLA